MLGVGQPHTLAVPHLSHVWRRIGNLEDASKLPRGGRNRGEGLGHEERRKGQSEMTPLQAAERCQPRLCARPGHYRTQDSLLQTSSAKHPRVDQFIHSTNEYSMEEAPNGRKSQCNASKWRHGGLVEKQQDL
nr:uncharacterized protein LOC112426727 [Macaca nemestrina]